MVIIQIFLVILAFAFIVVTRAGATREGSLIFSLLLGQQNFIPGSMTNSFKQPIMLRNKSFNLMG